MDGLICLLNLPVHSPSRPRVLVVEAPAVSLPPLISLSRLVQAQELDWSDLKRRLILKPLKDESTSSFILRLVSSRVASIDPVVGSMHSPEGGLAGALAIAVGDGAAERFLTFVHSRYYRLNGSEQPPKSSSQSLVSIAGAEVSGLMVYASGVDGEHGLAEVGLRDVGAGALLWSRRSWPSQRSPFRST